MGVGVSSGHSAELVLSEARLSICAGAVRGLAFLQDATGQQCLAAACDGEAAVWLWNAESHAELHRLRGLSEAPAALAAPQGPTNYVCAGCGTACLLWDMRATSRKPMHQLSAPSGFRINSIAIGNQDPAGLVAAGSSEGQAAVWDIRRGAEPCGHWSPHAQTVRS